MIFHDVQQNSDDWLSFRLGKATGSGFASFMANYGKSFGEPAHKYALQIALEKITGAKSEYSFTNSHMARGHEQEPIAKMLYEEAYFCEVKNGGFYCCETHGTSPDGNVGSDGLIEIKSVIATTQYDTLKRKSYDPAYKWQLMAHFLCTGRDYIDFVSYCSDFPMGKQLCVTKVERSQNLENIAMVENRLNDFLELVEEKVRFINGINI